MRWAVIAAVAAAMSLGCGSASSASSENTADEPTTELTIAFWHEGRGEGAAKRWTLRCDPVGGTHTRRASACARLYGMQRPFAPQKDVELCTQIYGGPDQAVVSGEHRGNRVWVVLSLTDGCKIARFKQLEFLVPGLHVTSAGVSR
jgi:Subtilisin inhibitor-like